LMLVRKRLAGKRTERKKGFPTCGACSALLDRRVINLDPGLLIAIAPGQESRRSERAGWWHLNSPRRPPILYLVLYFALPPSGTASSWPTKRRRVESVGTILKHHQINTVGLRTLSSRQGDGAELPGRRHIPSVSDERAFAFHFRLRRNLCCPVRLLWSTVSTDVSPGTGPGRSTAGKFPLRNTQQRSCKPSQKKKRQREHHLLPSRPPSHI